jgi:hypothetical protein
MALVRVLFCLALFLPALARAEVDLPAADQQAIRAAALDYAEGWYHGDHERLARSLHPKLSKRAYLPQREGGFALDELDKRALIDRLKPENKARYVDKPRRAQVSILDGFGRAATVKLTMDGWVDYMHLSKTPDGRWQIIHVLWELLPPQ